MAAKKLSEAKMIQFNQTTNAFTITDLGRIAAKYYIRHTSIEIFNKEFKPLMSEADVLGMLCMSTEVSTINFLPFRRDLNCFLPFSLTKSKSVNRNLTSSKL